MEKELELLEKMNVSRMKLETKDYLDSMIEGLFITMHKKYKTSSGDITPDQSMKLDSLMNELSELIATQVYQNI